MKIGMRKPSLKKSLKARTTAKWKRQAKRAVIPWYGKKGTGWVTNPKKALYNKVYHKTTFGVSDLARLANNANKKQPAPQKRKEKPQKNQGDSMKKILKWFGYLIVACTIIAFSPIFIVLGILGLWFFTKKKPNKKWKKLSFIATILSIIGIIAIATNAPNKDEPKKVEPSSSLVSNSSTSSSATSSSSSSTSSTTSASSSSSSSLSSTSEPAPTTPAVSSEPASAEPQPEPVQPAPAPEPEPAPVQEVAPTPEPAPAPQEEPQAGGGYFRDVRGRWHRPNGQYASKAEIAAAGLPW